MHFESRANQVPERNAAKHSTPRAVTCSSSHLVVNRRLAKAFVMLAIGLGLSLCLAEFVKADEPISPTSEEWKKIDEVLSKEIHGEFFDDALLDCFDILGDMLEVKFFVDEAALSKIGLGRATPVTISFRELQCEVALSRMLSPLKLSWSVEGEAILITTSEEAQARLVRRVWNVADLIEMGDADEGTREKRLKDTLATIENTIAPESWEAVGGPGTMSGMSSMNTLVVQQTPHVIREIDRLLSELKKAQVRD